MKLSWRIPWWGFFIVGSSLLWIPSYGGEGYGVSGIVTFPEAEVVFVSLYTADRFKNFKNRPLPPAPYTQVIELSPEQKKAGKAAFCFTGIPKGIYGVIAFRETKKNHKKDWSLLFKNPISNYRLTSFSGAWEDVQCIVDKEVRGIEIRFQNVREHTGGERVP